MLNNLVIYFTLLEDEKLTSSDSQHESRRKINKEF